jgi:rod shape determining protein RodA
VLVLLMAFTFLIFRGLMIAAEAPTVFTRLLAGAVTLSFFTYAFVNMGMVSGILPVVGVPLPFVSYGGTAMVRRAAARSPARSPGPGRCRPRWCPGRGRRA